MAWTNTLGWQLEHLPEPAAAPDKIAALIARIRTEAPDLLPVLGLDTEETT